MEDNKSKDFICNILDELSTLENNAGIRVLYACGANCFRNSVLFKNVRMIHEEFMGNDDNDAIFKAFKSRYYNSTNFSKTGNIITLIFDKCTCSIVESGIANPYLCNCTIGFSKAIFEELFNHKVEVVLEKSILRGDDICRQIITLL